LCKSVVHGTTWFQFFIWFYTRTYLYFMKRSDDQMISKASFATGILTFSALISMK
jgi:hypothetical protein